MSATITSDWTPAILPIPAARGIRTAGRQGTIGPGGYRSETATADLFSSVALGPHSADVPFRQLTPDASCAVVALAEF